MTAQARFAARAGGGPCLQARGGGKAARGAPLLRLVARSKRTSADAPCFSFSSLPAPAAIEFQGSSAIFAM